MDADAWLSRLEVAIAGLGERSAGPVTDEERDALLDLARIAAHGSERWTAPITTYLVGLALADQEPARRGPTLRALVDALG